MESLIEAAENAGKRAHAPYSNYRVGAALATESGKIFSGCNIENRSYGATVCAERVALYQAIYSGEKAFVHLAVVSEGGSLPIPCGLCLQALSEFCSELDIVVSNGQVKKKFLLSQLHPIPFGTQAK